MIKVKFFELDSEPYNESFLLSTLSVDYRKIVNLLVQVDAYCLYACIYCMYVCMYVRLLAVCIYGCVDCADLQLLASACRAREGLRVPILALHSGQRAVLQLLLPVVTIFF